MLSKRAKKVLLHTSIALVMSLSATALPMNMIDTVVEAAVINTQTGNLTVTAYSLWAYNGPTGMQRQEHIARAQHSRSQKSIP